MAMAAPATESTSIEENVLTMQVLVQPEGATAYLGGISSTSLRQVSFPLGKGSIAELVPQGDPPSSRDLLATRDDPLALFGTSSGLVQVGEDGVLTPALGGLRGSAFDVDGDGREDLCSVNYLILTHEPALQTLPIPNPTPTPPWGAHRCIPDIDGDGHADLLQFHYGGIMAIGYFAFATTTTVFMHPGGPNGYAEQPAWSIDLYGVVHRGVPVQTDADPELELLLATGSLDNFFEAGVSIFYVLDDLGSPTPTPTIASSIEGLDLDGADHYTPAEVVSLGDLDGDGTDEVAVCTLTGHDGLATDHGEIRVLTAKEEFDTERPLFVLPLREPVPDGEPISNEYDSCTIGAQDVNLDGHVDIYLLASASTDPALLQVWYGPLYEPPEPVPHTAQTGDTALPSTEPTGTALHTAAHTGTATVDTGTPSPTAPPASTADPRCGCASTPSGSLTLAMMMLFTVLRRR